MTLSESRSVVSAPQTSGDGIKSRTAVNCQSRQTDFMLRYAFAFPVPERQIDGVCGGNDLNVCFGAPRLTPGGPRVQNAQPVYQRRSWDEPGIETGTAHETADECLLRHQPL